MLEQDIICRTLMPLPNIYKLHMFLEHFHVLNNPLKILTKTKRMLLATLNYQGICYIVIVLYSILYAR